MSDQIAALRGLTVAGLRERYLQVFGEETRSNNKPFLFKRIAYRLQEIKHGGLSPRAQKRAEELAKDAPIRRGRLGPVEAVAPVAAPSAAGKRDPRVPPLGTELVRRQNDAEHKVTVLADGFEYKGKRYRSLSAIAKEITGVSWNGYLFFGLDGDRREP